MSYSPYGDRDSGSTRTDVDTDVHENHVHEGGVPEGGVPEGGVPEDGVDQSHDPDANGHDANAASFQRESADPTDVAGTDDDAADDDDIEASADDADADDDADANDDGDAIEADGRTIEYGDGDVQPEAAGTTDVDAAEQDVAEDEDVSEHGGFAEHADEAVERDSAADDVMGGEDAAAEPATAVDGTFDRDVADAAPEFADATTVRTDGNDADGNDAGVTDASVTDAGATDAIDESATDESDTIDRAGDDSATVDGAYDGGATDGGVVTDTAIVDDEDVRADDGTAVVDGAPAVDADYVAVGVAEPLTESEAADIAEVDGLAPAPVDAVPVDAEAAADADATPEADATREAEATPVGMMPGDAPVVDTPPTMPNADEVHDRWQQIQLGFIDDPRGSVESARSLVVESVEARISALRDRQSALDGWQSEATPDTEVLRAAIQGYRDLLNSLTETP
jgi:hypothetical protein